MYTTNGVSQGSSKKLVITDLIQGRGGILKKMFETNLRCCFEFFRIVLIYLISLNITEKQCLFLNFQLNKEFQFCLENRFKRANLGDHRICSKHGSQCLG